MSKARHTRMAPAGIQRQLQRMFIPANYMHAEAQNNPTFGVSGVNAYWDFDEALKEEVYVAIPVPLDYMAGTDAWAYPVFSMNVNLYAKVRWGLEYLPQMRGMSIAGIGNIVEASIDADGTGTVIPPRAQWLTLGGNPIMAGEPVFQRDDFTLVAHLAAKLYRDGASALDNHPGHAYLYGLAVVYESFI